MYYLLFIATSLIWGSGFFLMKKASLVFGPLTIAALSTIGGSLVLWSFWLIRRRKWRLHRRQILPLLFISLSGYMYTYAMQPFLIDRIGHGFIGMLVSLVPMLTVIVSIPLLTVFPSRIQLAGVMIGLFCIALMMIDGLNRDVEPVILAFAVSVPLFYAICNTLVQRHFSDIPPVVLAALFMTGAAIALTPLSLIFEEIRGSDGILVAVAAIGVLSIFARGFAMLFFYKMIQGKGPLFAGMVTYVIPVEALLWSWIDNERVTPLQISAIAIVLLMVGIVQWDIVRRSR